MAVACVLLTACSGASAVTLDDLAQDPKSVELGDRVFVDGFVIDPKHGETSVCEELGPGDPPTATGPCIEVEGVTLSKAGFDRHKDGVWWDPEERQLDCLVVRRPPVHTDPDRVVLSCVPRGSRP